MNDKMSAGGAAEATGAETAAPEGMVETRTTVDASVPAEAGMTVEQLRESLGPDAEKLCQRLQELIFDIDGAKGSAVDMNFPENGQVRAALAMVVGAVRQKEIPVDRGLSCDSKLSEALRRYAVSKGLKRVDADCVRALLSEPVSNLGGVLRVPDAASDLFRYISSFDDMAFVVSGRNSELVGHEVLSLMLAAERGGEAALSRDIAQVVISRVYDNLSGEISISNMIGALGFTGFSLWNIDLLASVRNRLSEMANGRTVDVSTNRNGDLIVSFSGKTEA